MFILEGRPQGGAPTVFEFMKPFKRSIHGIFLLDKPIGISSNKALKKVQHLFRAKKAGHTGSLDPLATGLLPICLGEATKLSQYLLESDKRYRVEAYLGQRTTTADAEGEIIAEKPAPPLSKELIETALQSFRGEINQTPPIYSALKLDGKPLYQYAREGIAISPKSRQVHIYELKLIELNAPRLQLEVHCSKGTYIRSLVDDLGELLGCGAHVSELRRIACAGYKEVEMISLETLEREFVDDNPAALDHYLIPMNTALPDWPELVLNEEQFLAFQRGQSIPLSSSEISGWVRVCASQGELLGLAELVDSTLYPRKVFQL